MLSEHCSYLCRYLCLLLLIPMLWHRCAIFESKGDKLSSSAECRIRTQGLGHLFASRLNACWQTDWAIEDQAKILELDSPSLWSASIQPTRPHTIYIRYQAISRSRIKFYILSSSSYDTNLIYYHQRTRQYTTMAQTSPNLTRLFHSRPTLLGVTLCLLATLLNLIKREQSGQ